MTTDPSPDLDRRLRDAFAADPDAAERVAAGALADTRPRRPRGWALRLAVAGALVAMVAAAAVLQWPARPVPEAAVPISLSGSFTDGVFVVSLPDGSTAIFSANEHEDRPPDGYGIVLVEGELK